MFQNVANLFRIPDIRRRILVTLGFLLVYRVGWNIPIPGIDLDVLKSLGGGGGEGSDFAQLFGIISGGGIFSCALFSLGIMPYISASIIFSMVNPMTTVVNRVLSGLLAAR